MNRILSTDELWPQALAQTRTAAESGAQQPLQTSERVIKDEGLRLIVRIARRLDRKQSAPAPRETGTRDPFSPPYEPDLHVGAISETHEILLNKFNVLDGHLLFITREDAGQTERLNRYDFRAMLRGLAGIDGLAFYNGGTEAGASQPHKHLQLVPLPLADPGPAFPLAPLLAETEPSGLEITRSPALPFAHAIAAMPPRWREAPDRAADEVLALHDALWSALGYELAGRQQPLPYNLLATRDWLWLVPRSREDYRGLGVNALGYAGALLVRDETEFATLREIGPMRLLAEVATLPGRAG